MSQEKTQELKAKAFDLIAQLTTYNKQAVAVQEELNKVQKEIIELQKQSIKPKEEIKNE